MRKNTIHISALTQGKDTPSSRFRWRQYEALLNKSGFSTKEYFANPSSYPPKERFSRPKWLLQTLFNNYRNTIKSNESDIRFVQREMVSTLYTSERYLKEPFIFDVDDAIFLNQRWNGIDKIAKKSSIIICGNSYLADYFQYFNKVVIIPTAIDTKRFIAKPNQLPQQKIIGWSGSSSGFKYLYTIEDSLEEILKKFPDYCLKIVSDIKPKFKKLPPERLIFEKWSSKTEVESLQSFSLGIMPLKESNWELGKCSFKMLTYMAVGIPVVVSPVGMNNEVLHKGNCGLSAKTKDDWIEAISSIIKDESSFAIMGGAGRKIIEDNYSLDILSKKLIDVIKNNL